MDKDKALDIINRYGAAMMSDTKSFKPMSLLPYSKDVIRAAIFSYCEHEALAMIGKNQLEEPIIIGYARLNTFIPDDKVEYYNQKIGSLRAGTEIDSELKEMIMLVAGDEQKINEITEHIRNCKLKKLNRMR